MLRMKIHRVDRQHNNTPIISNREIDDFAHAVLKDYKPELLEEPGAVRYEHFLESYLGVTILYKDIYSKDPERPIFGATAFRNSSIRIFDRENERIRRIKVAANTVIIDNFVMEPGKEGLANFTGLHEGGHILIHRGVYAPEYDEQTYFEEELPPMVYCHRENVENFVKKQERTAKQWREHHADYFAAAFAMPNKTFRPFVNQLLREHDVWKGSIILGRDGDLDILAEEILPDYIAEVYGVSRRAAFIKLKQCGFVVGAFSNRYSEAKLAY